MPATIDNDTLLKAFNQTIQALLDLGISFGSGNGDCPDVTVNNNVPVPSVTVNNYHTVNCSCGGGLSDGGSNTPSGPISTPDPEGDPPIGFDTWQEFRAYKCKAANWVVDGILWWTDHISSFSGTNSLVGVVGIVNMMLQAAILADTAAFIGVSIVAGLTGTWIALGAALVAFAISGAIAWSIFGDVSEAINENREALVCALYNSEPGQSRTDFMEAFNEAIDGFTAQAAISDIIDILLPNDITNLMFTKDDRIDILSAKDCSGCAGEEQQVIFGITAWTNIGTYQSINSINDNSIAWGNLTFNNGASLTFASGDYSSNQVVAVIIWSEERQGGVSSIYADGLQVSSGGAFTSGDAGGSYPTRYDIDPTIADEFVINLNIIPDATVFEVQFIILV